MEVSEIRNIVSDIRYLDWQFLVRMDGERPYLQVRGHGPDPNQEMKDENWTGRKWWLSTHMCKNEVIRTAYKALECAVKHEMDEMFTYRGAQIMSPHLDYDVVVDMMRTISYKDTRDNGMTGV